ncbi:MAG: Uma2 family endonuclease [Phormidesmis sp.]
MVANPIRWTVQDLEGMPDDWGQKRYEIIEGELIVTRAPHFRHQKAGGRIHVELANWSRRTELGEAVEAPGVVFTEADAVIPDVVWASNERLASGVDEAGHFVVAPELVVEVLSAGLVNEQRDRRSKLKLYSIYGVQEYWIVNWRLKTIEVYRRQDAQLQLIATLLEGDRLVSPLLSEFDCEVASIFE